MRSAFIAGFVKESQAQGLPDSEIMDLWKIAMDFPPTAEMFDKLANDMNNPVSIDEVETAVAMRKQAEFEQEIAEIEKKIG